MLFNLCLNQIRIQTPLFQPMNLMKRKHLLVKLIKLMTVSQYLTSLIHDPGELLDNQTRLIFAELTPKQQNIVIQCPDIYTALREQMDMGEVIDKKYRILTNLSENLQKINPKRLSGSEYTKINQYVAKNRNSPNTLSVEFETFRGLDAFCKEISLSIPQRKALIDVCDFTRNVQSIKLGYLVDRIGLTDIKLYRCS